MESLTLSAGLLLPWLGGTVWLMYAESRLSRAGRRSQLRQAGYGFFLGYAVLCLAILASDRWLEHVSWPWIMTFLALFAAGGWLAARFGAAPLAAAPVERPPMRPAQVALVFVLAAWIGLHLLFVTVELLSRPVYPWDAWLAWVYRAKAWFMADGLADIVRHAPWAAASSADIYTIDAAQYPLFVSLVPYWAALSLGRWSETLVNLPALLAGVAIGLALYGQCRESGWTTLASLAACYLLLSIPLFATHIALAGYADIWMAGFAGLGFIALMRGSMAKERSQTMLGLLMITLAMLVKNEAVVWFLAALLMQALINFRVRTNILAGLAFASGLLVAHMAGITHVDIPLLGPLGIVNDRLEIPFVGSFALEVHNVWRVYADNFFLMGSWNLLWLLVGGSLLLGAVGSRPFADPAPRAGAIFIIIFLATQLFIFGFTDQGVWADTYTAVNRLPLHFVPALIYAALAIIRARMAPPLRPHGVAESGGA